MWAKVESGSVTKVYARPTAITVGDVNYPQNIMQMWSALELKDLDIYEITTDSTNYKNPEYYNNTDITYTYASGAVTGAYGTATAKTLTTLKTRHKESVNSQASVLLQKYDWYTLREASGGTATPSAVTTYQAAVRTSSDNMNTAIDNAADVDALAALYVYNSDDPPTRPIGEFPNEPEI